MKFYTAIIAFAQLATLLAAPVPEGKLYFLLHHIQTFGHSKVPNILNAVTRRHQIYSGAILGSRRRCRRSRHRVIFVTTPMPVKTSRPIMESDLWVLEDGLLFNIIVA
jgi:hypothetical protein